MGTGWVIIVKVGSVSGLLSLLYLVLQNIRRSPKIKFDRTSCERPFDPRQKNDPPERAEITIHGQLQNQSLDPNSVADIHLVVWANERRNSTLRFGGNPEIIDKSTGEETSLPIRLAPREAKSLEVRYDLHIPGSPDEKIINTPEDEGQGNPPLYLPKHEYHLCLEDINGNFFDHEGFQRNREEMRLRWTFPNTAKKFRRGNVLPILTRTLKILWTKVAFHLKQVLLKLGIWK